MLDSNGKDLVWILQMVTVFFFQNSYVAEDFGSGESTDDFLTINVLFINSEDNKLAEYAVHKAIQFIQDNPDYEININLLETEAPVKTNIPVRNFLEEVCARYEDSILNGTPPHIVLDTTKSGPKSGAVKSITNALGLPTISASYGQAGDIRQWRDLSAMQQQYLLHVMPPRDIISDVIRLIATDWRLSNAAVLFDDTFLMEHKYKALFKNLPTKHIITRMEGSSNKERANQIDKLRLLNINNFFLLGSLKTIKSILESLDPLYFSRRFAWYAVTPESDTFNTIKRKNKFEIILIQPRKELKKLQHLEMLKEDYGLSKEPLVDSAFYFDLAIRTFVATRNLLRDKTGSNETMDYMLCDEFTGNNTLIRDINLRKYFTEVTEPNTFGTFEMPSAPELPFNGASYMKFIMDTFVINMDGGELVYKDLIGNWTAGIKTQKIANETKIMNLTAHIVHRIYTVVKPPFIIRDPNEPKGFKGFCIDLINEIAQTVEFDYVIHEVEDGKFGNMDENGTWDGVVRKLIDKEGDIGLGSLSVMAERENVIDFTVPFYDLVGITIMMSKPAKNNSIFKFLNVLEKEVWFCILGSFFFTSFLLWFFDKCSPYSFQNNREKFQNDDEKREFDFKECLWFCVTSLTPQGGGEAPRNISGRLVAATWWLFGFIIMSSYTANLAAFLTVSRLDSPIKSLDDLTNQYKILYAPLNNSAAMLYFKNMANIEKYFYNIWKDMALNDSLTPLERANIAVWDYPVSSKYTKIWQSIQEAGMPNTIEEAVARVRNSSSASGFAFLEESTDVRYLVTTNCDIQMVGEDFSRKPYAIAVQQGSHLKDQFNSAILDLLNKRSLEKLKIKWWNSDGLKCEKTGDSSDGINIQSIGGVFVVIFIGIGIAFLILTMEFWYFKHYKTPNLAYSSREGDAPKSDQKFNYFDSQSSFRFVKTDKTLRSRVKNKKYLPRARF